MLSMLWDMFSSWGLSGEAPNSGDHLMDTSGFSWLLICEPVILLVGSVCIGLQAVCFQYSRCA